MTEPWNDHGASDEHVSHVFVFVFSECNYALYYHQSFVPLVFVPPVLKVSCIIRRDVKSTTARTQRKAYNPRQRLVKYVPKPNL
jgi:hypothetical protein